MPSTMHTKTLHTETFDLCFHHSFVAVIFRDLHGALTAAVVSEDNKVAVLVST